LVAAVLERRGKRTWMYNYRKESIFDRCSVLDVFIEIAQKEV
jgi:hypothetical protein